MPQRPQSPVADLAWLEHGLCSEAWAPVAAPSGSLGLVHDQLVHLSGIREHAGNRFGEYSFGDWNETS